MKDDPTTTAGARESTRPPLVAHIIHRFATGGLENGLVNLINHTPANRYRHAVVSLTDVTEFQTRLKRPDVVVAALHKNPGNDFAAYRKVYQFLAALRPDIVHTRNISTLEYLIVAALLPIRARVHGEHGRDVYDPDGLNFKYNLIRRSMRPFVHRYVAVSADLTKWLINTVRVRPERVSRICNGVDTNRFYPRDGLRGEFGPKGFADSSHIVVGTVGRMELIKDPLNLVKAFLDVIKTNIAACSRLRLAMIGDGALREEAQRLVAGTAAQSLVWFAGERRDIPEIMRGLDLFVLPSLREGISNTILEAMASGLPVVATRVGGNLELVDDGQTGTLVSPEEPAALAQALQLYLRNPKLLNRFGCAGRHKAETEFSIGSMVSRYLGVYDEVLRGGREGICKTVPPEL